ncbi:Hypothetical predicted protein [Podarcis lilfordi]|uniref:Uncharacterized protein n=1 Tax=Podarcis lilfordi TaxID=74358 RepID=A0AA35KTY3_9SAUR|nr:Hypothetical predicted protein [Podarcis lilfordi]
MHLPVPSGVRANALHSSAAAATAAMVGRQPLSGFGVVPPFPQDAGPSQTDPPWRFVHQFPVSGGPFLPQSWSLQTSRCYNLLKTAQHAEAGFPEGGISPSLAFDRKRHWY